MTTRIKTNQITSPLSGTITTEDMIVSGNLTVSGTTTTVNTDDLLIEDLNITLANGSANSFVADGAGITIDGANATFIYEHSGGQTRFETNNGLYVTGSSTNSIAVLKATRSNASGSNNTYTLEVDSSAHTSNLTSAGAMAVDVNSGRAFTINGFGRVGVGTDTPSSRLEVYDNNYYFDLNRSGDSGYSGIKFSSTGTARGYLGLAGQTSHFASGAEQYDLILRSEANLILATESSQRVTILSNGNIGIGETAPDTTLHIKKNQSSAASSIKLENSAGGDNSSFDIDWQLASSGTSARIRAVRTNNPGAGDTNLVFSTSDNGTSVDDRLVINNLGRVLVGSGNHTADGITIGAVNGNSELDLAHPTAKRWRILSASTGDFYLQNKTDSYNSLIVTGNSNTGYLVSQFATQVRLVLGSSGAYNNNTSNWIRGNSDYLQFNNAGSGFTWETLGSEVMRLDSDGLGIGTQSPETKLDVLETYDTVANILANGTYAAKFTSSASGDTGRTQGILLGAVDSKLRGAAILGEAQGSGNAHDMIFAVSSSASTPTERMRLNNSGNLLVGKTSDVDAGVGVRVRGDGLVQATRSNADPLSVNRTNSDGMIIALRKNQGLVGSIGVTATDNLVIHSTASGHYGLEFGSLGIAPTANTGSSVDNIVDLGHSTKRFDDIYATNGTIQTSDVNEKQQIATLTDAEVTAAKSISKLFKTFKWNDSVAEKGDDARTHTGVIAQQVETAMADAGLNASDYAFFISTTWWEIQTEVPEVEAVEEVLDERGNVSVEAVEYQEAYTRYDTYETAEEAPEGAVERNRKGIRYPELLSFIGAATEQRLSSIESRLDALEAS